MSEKTKRMPSEHRITAMEDAEIKHISNDFGEFVLVKIPMSEVGEALYQYPVVNKAVEALESHLQSWSEQIQDAETDKNLDYANAQQ